MLVRRLLSVAPMLLTCTLCALGQLPKKLEKCLPYPTLAQEIREMQPPPMRARVHVVRVEFDSNDGIPADAQEEISGQLQGRVFEPPLESAYLNNLENEIADVGVRGGAPRSRLFRSDCSSKTNAPVEGRYRRQRCRGHQRHARTSIPDGRHSNRVHR